MALGHVRQAFRIENTVAWLRGDTTLRAGNCEESFFFNRSQTRREIQTH
jgi:hypothetical protein